MIYRAPGPDSTEARPDPTAGPGFALHGIVGNSPQIRAVLAVARAASEHPERHVLLTGEPGTGRRLLATALHYDGPRSSEPCLSLDCEDIPEPILDVELFGRPARPDADSRPKRGLLELAGHGTLIVDSVHRLPRGLQPRLTRALTEGHAFRGDDENSEFEVRSRVIASTKAALEELVAGGTFREDLFLLLAQERIDVPPLRAREGDALTLARRFIAQAAAEREIDPPALSPDAERAILSHTWPGNVRELKYAIARAVGASNRGQIAARDLQIARRSTRSGDDVNGEAERRIVIPPEGMSLAELESEAVRITMEITDGNKSAAARTLGISRPTLLRKLQRARQEST